MQSPPGAETVIDGRRCLYFAGTAYLGLQAHPRVIAAACDAARKYGIHTATSRSGFGDNPPTLEVERRAAEFFGTEAALYVVSGYVVNQAVMATLSPLADVAFVDECSHYSVMDALRLIGKPVHAFRHRDAAELKSKLKQHLAPGDRPFVASDGVFAATGAIAPVAQYQRLLENYRGSLLCVDDAHAVGVLGDRGRGTYEHVGITADCVNVVHQKTAEQDTWPALYSCGTLSKALGGHGGIIAGSAEFIDCVKASSAYYHAASAPAAPVAAATAKALELLADDTSLRARLWQNVDHLKFGLREMGLEADNTPTPIIALVIESAGRMEQIQRQLIERDVAIGYSRQYTGVGLEGMLRIAVFATHTAAMIDRLLGELRRLL